MANSHSGNTSSSELISSVCWLVGWYQIKFIRHYRTSNLADGNSYLTVKAVIKDASRKTILALSSIHHISGDQLSQESQMPSHYDEWSRPYLSVMDYRALKRQGGSDWKI